MPQRNGFKIGAVVFFLLLSAWYLFPSAQGLYYAGKVDNLSEEERADFENTNYGLLQRVKDRALKLGLDLQGGMHITLEVGLVDLLQQLAGDRRDEVFDDVLAAAIASAAVQDNSIIDAFVQEFESRDVTQASPDIFGARKSPAAPATLRSLPTCANRRMMPLPAQ